ITGAMAVVFLLGCAVVYNFPPSQYSFYPRCPFFAATHWLCPGCGSTRALYSLLHGDVLAAWHYNALFTLLGPVVLAWLAFCCYRVMRYDQIPKMAISRSVTACLVVAVVLFAIARNTIFAF
ncbi:MAG TPA: DUF2752 domain-containing protein, partial [Candidatus Angelobacter sp.]|nr:DUF2752 domain-containing protein [Candidatus Angelobacter sp.]